MAVADTNAINYSNTRIRALADRLAQAYNLAQAIIQEGTAKGIIAGATPSIPNDATLISDGAVQDGRTQIAGADVYATVAIAQQIITNFQATSNVKLNQILKVAVNTNP